MIKVEKHYLSVSETAEELGISRRGVYRAAKRAEADGHLVRDKVMGRPVFLRGSLKVLKSYHYDPHDQSPEAVARRQEWGCRGAHTPAKRGRPFDRDRFRGITIHDLEMARMFVAEVGGSCDHAVAAIKMYRKFVAEAGGDSNRAIEAIKLYRKIIVEAGGACDSATAAIKLYRKIEKTSRRGTSCKVPGAQKEA